MRLCTVLAWVSSKILLRFIGENVELQLNIESTANSFTRFKDIGYQHIPFFNCPNSPKCRGCVKGRFTDGEAWLHREDCRPNWFKYVGNEWAVPEKEAAA